MVVGTYSLLTEFQRLQQEYEDLGQGQFGPPVSIKTLKETWRNDNRVKLAQRKTVRVNKRSYDAA